MSARLRVPIWAIAIAVFIDGAIGGFWYSGALFGEAWHSLQGLDAAALAERTWVHGLSLLLNALKMTVIALLLSLTGVKSWRGGAVVGVLCWLGLVVTIWTGSTLYSDRSLQVLAINMGFHLIVLTLASSVMGRFIRA